MSNESTKKTIGVALGVCFVCSILVSTAAVTLKSIQEANKKRDKIKNILMAGDLLEDESSITETYKKKIKPEIIDLKTGDILPESRYNTILNIEDFDIKTLTRHPEYSQTIFSEKDIAQIKRIPEYMIIYIVKEHDQTIKYILPVYGKGLWSTMFGLLALDKDLKTIKGFTFYEHGETPGLGGEVDNPVWKSKWAGKYAFDENNNLRIEVLKGRVDPDSPEARYQIDGLTGSTLTTRSVHNLVRFWLGDKGYGPFIMKLRN
jgi:Na+-transporting NADH:ubiquinone oxidoreductase subunit C